MSKKRKLRLAVAAAILVGASTLIPSTPASAATISRAQFKRICEYLGGDFMDSPKGPSCLFGLTDETWESGVFCPGEVWWQNDVDVDSCVAIMEDPTTSDPMSHPATQGTLASNPASWGSIVTAEPTGSTAVTAGSFRG